MDMPDKRCMPMRQKLRMVHRGTRVRHREHSAGLTQNRIQRREMRTMSNMQQVGDDIWNFGKLNDPEDKWEIQTVKLEE
ncbi:MAG: hypothetical protein BA864_05110 [Desulfuromonadales bacterium C00003093]|nr:MAG: hypothetical protein BA864_05110 [Desulfuromonadales bacterium C00003093]